MHSYYLFLALDLARERAQEAALQRLAAEAGSPDSVVVRARRQVARAALAVARLADNHTAEKGLSLR